MDASYTGKKVAVLRKAKGWTQKELAEQLHVTDKAISKWERGLNYPDISLLEPLCALLGTTLVELLGMEQTPKEKAVDKITEISKTETLQLKQELHMRGILTLLVGLLSACVQFYISCILYLNGLHGLPLILTGGIIVVAGVVIGRVIDLKDRTIIRFIKEFVCFLTGISISAFVCNKIRPLNDMAIFTMFGITIVYSVLRLVTLVIQSKECA